MPVELATAGLALVRWGATYLLHSTCLLAGVWIFLRCHHGAGHALRESLWKMALVGGIATASFQLFLAPGIAPVQLAVALDAFRPHAADPVEQFDGSSPGASDQRSMEEHAADRLRSVNEAGAMTAEGGLWPRAQGISNAPGTGIQAVGPPALEAAGEAATDSSARPFDRNAQGSLRRESVMAIAVLGAALATIGFGVMRCTWQTIALRRRLARCSEIGEGRARDLLDELCRSVPRTHEILLLSTPDDSEPAAFGVRQWTIVLPNRAAQHLPEDELHALLAHELAHLVRGDSTWLLICRLVCSCLAFQPLNHLARREWQRAAEFLCDRWAVSRTGAPLALARCLAEVAGWRLARCTPLAVLAATGRKSSLADRIERLVESPDEAESARQPDVRSRQYAAAAVVLCLVAWLGPGVLVVGSPGSQPHRAEDRSIPVEITSSSLVVEGDGAIPVEDGGPYFTASGEDLSTASDPQPPRGIAPIAKEEGAATGPAPFETAALLNQLDEDLLELEGELAGLEVLLKGEASPAVARLAKRLRVEIGRLKARRRMLQAGPSPASKISNRN